MLAFESLNTQVLAPDQAIIPGARVVLADNHEETQYFLGPCAGGTSVDVDDQEILVITPASPLGRELVGRSAGDKINLPGGAMMVVESVT